MIDGQLSGTAAHVLIIKSGYSVTLSEVMTFLKGFEYLYPSLLCVFCRVDAVQIENNKYVSGSYSGTANESVSQANTHKVNATAIALALKATKRFK